MTPTRIFHNLRDSARCGFLQILRRIARHSLPVFLLTSSLTWTGCYFGRYAGYTHLSPSVGSDTSSPDEDFLYLDLNEGFYDALGIEPPLYELNTTENYGPSEQRDSVSNCEFLYDEEDPSAQEIICILDYMEQEFLTYDLSIVLNVPRGMCAHLITVPAWHYNVPAGYGPRTIYQRTMTRGTGEEATQTTVYCLQNANPSNTNPCSEDPIDRCPFLYQSFDGGEGARSNCCIGTYNVAGEESSSNNSWGGSIQNCLGGPGRTSWNRFDRNGLPARLVEYVLEDGLRRTFDINNLIEVSRGGHHSTPIANYLERLNLPVDDLLEGNIELPQFYRSSRTENIRTGNPFFTFSCEDSTGDTLYRINLMFREWNTYEEFIAFYDSGGGDETADPDVPGKGELGEEGDDCEYEERLPFFGSNPCNDYLDMDDIPENLLCRAANRDVVGYPCARYGEDAE